MYGLKTISREAVPNALAKAERYRLLNEPREAESICLDVLRVDPANQQALVTLLLATTDRFGTTLGAAVDHARQLLPQIQSEYERAYYEGVILERWAKAQMEGAMPRHVAGDWLRQAMHCYEKAESIRPPGNDDAILRWNTCARMIDSGLRHEPETSKPAFVESYDDEVPLV